MTFDEFMREVEKLKNKKLRSIKPGADVTIENVDFDEERVVLRNVHDEQRSRPFEEFMKIWIALNSRPAVHVDTVLGGSGTSRNQPETIVANLPFVQWLRVGQRKHLTLHVSSLHAAGTLESVDPVAAEKIRKSLRDSAQSLATATLVVTDDVAEVGKRLEGLSGIPLTPVGDGIYEQVTPKYRLLLVARSVIKEPIAPGAYPVVEGKSSGETPIWVGEEQFEVIADLGIVVRLLN